MTGSSTQNQNDTLNSVTDAMTSRYSPLLNERDSINKKVKNSSNSLEKTILQSRLFKINERIDDMNREILTAKEEFISSHPNSYASPTILYGLAVSNKISNELVKLLYNNFTDEIKRSIAGKLILNELDKRKINIKAADFTAKDVDNNLISLTQYKGKYILLNFWASWCIPCIKKVPQLKQFLKSYHSKGLEIINISVDTKKQNWVKAIDKYKIEKFHNIIAIVILKVNTQI